MSNKETVEFYMKSFAEGDHEKILSCLADEVEWTIHGHKILKGKPQFDMEIENDAFEGKPEIKLNRMTEENNIVAAEGIVKTKPRNSDYVYLAFCDIFEFENGKIKKLISYLTPMN